MGGKIKKCPFCGGDVDLEGWLGGDGRRGPECMTCGATAFSAKNWNTRTPCQHETTKDLFEALRCDFGKIDHPGLYIGDLFKGLSEPVVLALEDWFIANQPGKPEVAVEDE